MSDTDRRNAQSLATIARHLGDIVNGMRALNENLVAFHKYIKESDETYDEIVSGKGPMMVPREQPEKEGE